MISIDKLPKELYYHILGYVSTPFMDELRHHITIEEICMEYRKKVGYPNVSYSTKRVIRRIKNFKKLNANI